MIYFIYGEDTYRSREALKQIESDFIHEQSDMNVERFEVENLTAGSLETKIKAIPFLGSKRLIVINNILIDGKKDQKDSIVPLLDSVPDFTDLVFYESGQPDKRESIFKKLDKQPGRQVFLSLDSFGLRNWINQKVTDENFQITSAACMQLMLFVGPDLPRIENEINRLISFTKSSNKTQIEIADVDKLIEPNNNFKIFDLTDAMAAKNAKKALQVLAAFQKSGEDNFRLFNLIVHQFRTMLIVADLAKHDSTTIAKMTGIHPFVVKKILFSLKEYSVDKLITIYRKLEKTDWQVKRGEGDINTLLPFLVVEFCER
jgi:DNA polymerase III subunit delta